jgi:hypothetical protein
MDRRLRQQWLPEPARYEHGTARLSDVESLLSGCLEAAGDVTEAVLDDGYAREYMLPLSTGIMRLLPALHRLQANAAWLLTPDAVQNLGELTACSLLCCSVDSQAHPHVAQGQCNCRTLH